MRDKREGGDWLSRLGEGGHELGATVVDEPPDRLAPALCDAYLRVKATGQL